MAIQLPLGAHGIAAGVLLFSFAGLICSALVVWLTWSHRERTSCRFLSPSVDSIWEHSIPRADSSVFW